MKNLKTSLILGGSLLLSTASFTPVFAESVKTEGNNQTTVTQQKLFPSNSKAYNESNEKDVVIPKGKELSSEEMEKVQGESSWWVVERVIAGDSRFTQTTAYCKTVLTAICFGERLVEKNSGKKAVGGTVK